jgi:hypothetical protein
MAAASFFAKKDRAHSRKLLHQAFKKKGTGAANN